MPTSKIICSILLAAQAPCAAAETGDMAAPGQAAVSSQDALSLGQESAHRLRAHGEQVLRSGQPEKALKILERSVRLSPKDLETRILYARALEHGLENADDPHKFNLAVKQWLYVMRKAEFEDQRATARERLTALTGRAPRFYELPAQYLAQVLKPEPAASDQASKPASQIILLNLPEQKSR